MTRIFESSKIGCSIMPLICSNILGMESDILMYLFLYSQTLVEMHMVQSFRNDLLLNASDSAIWITEERETFAVISPGHQASSTTNYLSIGASSIDQGSNPLPLHRGESTFVGTDEEISGVLIEFSSFTSESHVVVFGLSSFDFDYEPRAQQVDYLPSDLGVIRSNFIFPNLVSGNTTSK